ncbi:MAG: hypothetical protein ABIH42_05830 [Planctomycetota bacterium]
MNFFERLLAIDRRLIFLVIATAIIISLFIPMGLEVAINPSVKSVYDKIESLPAGSVVLISNDYDPSSKPELYPMTIALLRHCFKKDLKVVLMTLWITGENLAADALYKVAAEFKDKKEGEDFIFLGAKVGGSAVIMQMGQDIAAAFPRDFKKVDITEIPLMKNIKTLSDFNYVISLTAGVPGIDTWIQYGSDYFRRGKPKVEFGGGCTGVMAAQYFPYIASGQLNGLIGAIKGAAEYEALANTIDKATSAMDAQSITHLIIIAFVIIGNLAYFMTRKPVQKQ